MNNVTSECAVEIDCPVMHFNVFERHAIDRWMVCNFYHSRGYQAWDSRGQRYGVGLQEVTLNKLHMQLHPFTAVKPCHHLWIFILGIC